MRCTHALVAALAVVLCAAGAAKADVFGTGANQFNMDFVPISGATNPASGRGIVANDYRMGTYEVTNDQWDKFTASLGVPVTGSPADGYDQGPTFVGANMPANGVSWYEALQFVNWLNTSTGHQAAYNFTGTQGTADYTWAQWSDAEAAPGTNLYRNKGAYYYLPTQDEWTKAAYWNGTSMQAFATKYATKGEAPPKGDGVTGTGWNYYAGRWSGAYPNEQPIDPYGPWAVGSGSEELNGTFDMMGNALEWSESPSWIDVYRQLMGGSFQPVYMTLMGGNAGYLYMGYGFTSQFSPQSDGGTSGFRVAAIPEPCSLTLLTLGAIGVLTRRRG